MNAIQVGAQFDDRDRREAGRRVEVIDAGGWPATVNPFVTVRVIAAPGQSWKVGRKSVLRAETLLRRYRPTDTQGAVS